ncbi:Tn3 family transposase [Streptomyces sp. NPDC051994]
MAIGTLLISPVCLHTASYSDIVFGLLTLAGFAYAPQLADLPSRKM